MNQYSFHNTMIYEIKTMIDEIKQLREKTKLPVSICHNALKQTSGNLDKALRLLREKSIEMHENVFEKDSNIKTLYTYLHHNYKYASLCQFSCETDYVSRSKEFIQFMEDICMHVAANELPGNFETLQLNYDIKDNVSSFKNLFLKQKFVRDESKTLGELLTTLVSITGEKIDIEFVSRKSI